MEEQLEHHGVAGGGPRSAASTDPHSHTAKAVGFPYGRSPPFSPLARPDSSPGLAGLYGTPTARLSKTVPKELAGRHVEVFGRHAPDPSSLPGALVRTAYASPNASPAPPRTGEGIRQSLPPWTPPRTPLAMEERERDASLAAGMGPAAGMGGGGPWRRLGGSPTISLR